MAKTKSNIIEWIQELMLRLAIYTRFDELRKKIYVAQLKRRKQINVVFIATFSSQWKYDDLYNYVV